MSHDTRELLRQVADEMQADEPFVCFTASSPLALAVCRAVARLCLDLDEPQAAAQFERLAKAVADWRARQTQPSALRTRH